MKSNHWKGREVLVYIFIRVHSRCAYGLGISLYINLSPNQQKFQDDTTLRITRNLSKPSLLTFQNSTPQVLVSACDWGSELRWGSSAVFPWRGSPHGSSGFSYRPPQDTRARGTHSPLGVHLLERNVYSVATECVQGWMLRKITLPFIIQLGHPCLPRASEITISRGC